jgi:hypothetical protein
MLNFYNLIILLICVILIFETFNFIYICLPLKPLSSFNFFTIILYAHQFFANFQAKLKLSVQPLKLITTFTLKYGVNVQVGLS